MPDAAFVRKAGGGLDRKDYLLRDMERVLADVTKLSKLNVELEAKLAAALTTAAQLASPPACPCSTRPPVASDHSCTGGLDGAGAGGDYGARSVLRPWPAIVLAAKAAVSHAGELRKSSADMVSRRIRAFRDRRPHFLT